MRAKPGLARVALTLALLQFAPASLGRESGQATLAQARAVFDTRLALEQRLHDIGWRLSAANARFCAQTVPSIGLRLHDMASYGDPDGVRRLLRLNQDFAVLTAADGSPVGEVELPANSGITAIDGADPNAWPADPPGDWRRANRAHDWIDQRLRQNSAITLTFASGEAITLVPSLTCASRFELGGKGKRALADGSRVVLEREFPAFEYQEDELAAAVAHELAHNLLSHRAWLEANGRSLANIRLTEREADRLMPWLLANAGYDPGAATRFMQRWGPDHSGGIFRKRSHDGWDERVTAIAAEVVLVQQYRDDMQGADWRTLFRREIRLPN